MPHVSVVIILNLFTLCGNAEPLDVLKIISKTKIEVEAVLGKPVRVETFKPDGQNCQCERFYYLNGTVSVIYLDDRANRIFMANSVEHINLDKSKINSFHKWNGFSEIRVTNAKECCTIG
jgi:hypothetical protein